MSSQKWTMGANYESLTYGFTENVFCVVLVVLFLLAFSVCFVGVGVFVCFCGFGVFICLFGFVVVFLLFFGLWGFCVVLVFFFCFHFGFGFFGVWSFFKYYFFFNPDFSEQPNWNCCVLTTSRILLCFEDISMLLDLIFITHMTKTRLES